MTRMNSKLVTWMTPLVAVSIAYACSPKNGSKADATGGAGGSSSTSGGTGVTTLGGAAGLAGAPDAAGSLGTLEAGAAGEGGGGAAGEGGAGGTTGGTSTCGGLEQVCCNGSCDNSLVCLGAATCSCAQALFGAYILRGDGEIYAEGAAAGLGNQAGVALSLNIGAHVSIVNASTGLALAGVTTAQDGLYHGCAAAAGSAWCWAVNATSGNAYGQLGKGTIDSNSALYGATQVLKGPTQPLQNVLAIAGGWSNTACAITQDGKLYCWGDLQWALNGGTKLSSAYAQVVTTDGSIPLAGVVQAAVGTDHFCAIIQGATNKEVWCWGNNASPFSALGLGDSTNRQYPTQVAVGLENPSLVVIGNGYGTTCALDGAGVRGVKCWGYNSYGATGIGDANATSVLRPTTVVQSGAALDSVTDIQSANQSFCALRTDHTLWCWGAGAASPSAVKYGVPHVVAVGSPKEPRFLTDDGVYHLGPNSRAPNCGPL